MPLRGAVGVTVNARDTMNIKQTSWGLSLVITIMLGAYSPGAVAQIVFNGGFEIPLVAPGSATYTAGQSFGGWTVDLGSVSLNSECPFSGLQFAGLSGTVHQDLNTIAGAQYTLSYARTCEYGCGNGCDAVSHGVFLTWGAETVLDNSSTGGWARSSHIFVATDVTTRLSFRDNKGISLDDVSVVPASYPLAIRRLDNTHARVSWSTNATGYVLEYAAALSALTWWTTATNAPEIIGDDFVVTLNTASRQQFFRLRKQ